MTTVRFDAGSPYKCLRHEAAGDYVRILVRGHVLADQRGRVMAHRAVLYDAIGDGPHRCRWCGMDGLRWDLPRLDAAYLVVDHLDGDSFHNTLDNLVPAHGYCNSYRSTIEQLGIPWETFADVPPEHRPALRHTRTGDPTPAALELVRQASVEGFGPPPEPLPQPATEKRLPPIRKELVRWEDLVG